MKSSMLIILFLLIEIIKLSQCLLEWKYLVYDSSSEFMNKLIRIASEKIKEKDPESDYCFLDVYYLSDLSEHYQVYMALHNKRTYNIQIASVHLQSIMKDGSPLIKYNSIGIMNENYKMSINDSMYIVLQLLVMEKIFEDGAIMNYVEEISVYGYYNVVTVRSHTGVYTYFYKWNKEIEKFEYKTVFKYNKDKPYI